MVRARARKCLTVAALLVACGSAGAVAVAAVHGTRSGRAASAAEQRARAIGRQAYVYGYALLAEQQVITNFPANRLISVTKLSTPSLRVIVLPNVDTLYTVARLTLNAGPLVVHVPEEHGRYYTFELLDAYTNVFGYIGRRVTGTHAGNFAIVGPGWRGSLPSGVKPIHSPTNTVFVIGRTLVKSSGDVAAVNAIQRGYTLTPLSGSGATTAPPVFLTTSTLRPAPVPGGLAFYDAMGAAMKQDPPPVAERSLLRRFASVGIGPGRSPSTEGLDSATRKGLLEGASDGRHEIDGYGRALQAGSERQHNGWIVAPKTTGRYGTNYLLRGYIAKAALGANVPAEATYPAAFSDHAGATLTGAHRYVVHFAARQLPPVNAFWSLTMYAKDAFLVTNPINRYAIGDRTRGLHKNRDGSLDLVVQHSAPHGNRSNWLPAPKGVFLLFLRLYQPRASVLRGSWPLPTITRTR
jgi:hypothetical protein